MYTPRIIVSLLLSKRGLVKTVKFKNPTYVGASAVAASSMFIFYGPLRSVLIDYPSREKIRDIFGQSDPQ